MPTRWGVTFALLLLALVSSFAAFVLGGHRVDPALPAGPGSPKPKVRLIATGGTIANGTSGRLTAEELARMTSGLEGVAEVEAEQFSNTASTALTLAHWLELARRLNTVFGEDDRLAGAVVTTGTDTLEETAYFLNLTVRTDRPVVLVGSMRHTGDPDYDGAHNLLDGVRVAADPGSRGRGALVVLNGEINAAREVTKTDGLRLDSFKAGSGVLGAIDGERVVYHRRLTKRHSSASEFDVKRVQGLPRVDIVMVYQDASGDIIRTLADHGAQGIVIAAAGAGATSGSQDEGISYAIEKGVSVVISSRTVTGRVPARTVQAFAVAGRAPDLTRIAAEDLPAVKARILLMLALTVTKDRQEIQRMFREY